MVLDVDFVDVDVVVKFVEDVLSIKGYIDILLNNGGIIFRVLVIDFFFDEWKNVFVVNIDLVFLFS